MQLTAWLLVEVALLLNVLTQISLTKSGFNYHSVIEITSQAMGTVFCVIFASCQPLCKSS
jgi:hypothetical protein